MIIQNPLFYRGMMRAGAVLSALVATVLAGIVSASSAWAVTLDGVDYSKLPGDRVQIKLQLSESIEDLRRGLLAVDEHVELPDRPMLGNREEEIAFHPPVRGIVIGLIHQRGGVILLDLHVHLVGAELQRRMRHTALRSLGLRPRVGPGDQHLGGSRCRRQEKQQGN